MISNCPGSQRFKQPQPENIKCPFCGADVEIWTDEAEALCPKCRKTTTREEGQSCLDWCKYARECVGDEIYNRFLKGRKKV
jgi:predicted amidophosphoribosyltransferase